MALFDDQDEDRTETATAYRREEFRKKGTVALSREALSVVLLLGVGGSLYFTAGQILTEFRMVVEKCFVFASVSVMDKQAALELKNVAMKSWFWMVGPVMLTAMVAGFLASVAQVGFFVTWDPLAVNWARINPLEGAKRILSGQGLVDAIKAFFKLGLAGWITWVFLKGEILTTHSYLGRNAEESLRFTLMSVSKLFFILLLAYGVLAIADYFWQWIRVEKQMKMTRREAKEEFKLREGDPLIKSRIKSIQRRLARSRMMDAIPKADVVVTNPTHFAVAIQYDPETMAAPKVIAKGAGLIALKIKELARFHHVPVVENKPLARTLFKEMEIGQSIPKELYKAVAEVLAYVYRLRDKTRSVMNRIDPASQPQMA